MPCQVGITTNPDQRRKQWENEYSSLRNWQIMGRHNNREDAQRQETEFARQYGCEAHPGGDEPDRPNSIWYVYRFDHSGY